MSINEKAPLRDRTLRDASSCVFYYQYSKAREGVKGLASILEAISREILEKIKSLF